MTMAVIFPPNSSSLHTMKHIRRSATTVMAGSFDQRPSRDVLTSLLNGVGPYKEIEKEEEEKIKRKQEKRERRDEKKKAKAAARAEQGASSNFTIIDPNFASTSSLPQMLTSSGASSSTMCRTRPTIHIPAIQRSVSVTPSPPQSPQRLASTPASTPGPSISSSTSRTSSKRPRTPDDGEVLLSRHQQQEMGPPPPRKKRVAVKKGWKGWKPIEASPPPSEKLINLDVAPVLQERRTRSGKSFDAISIGNNEWV